MIQPRLLAAVALLQLCACSSSPPLPRTSARAGAPRYVPEAPPEHSPAPQTRAQAGETTGLSVRSGDEAARRLVLQIVQALMDGDEGLLARNFQDPIVDVSRRTSRPRAEVLAKCLQLAEPLRLRPELSQEDLLDLSRLRVIAETDPRLDGDAVLRVPLRPLDDRAVARKLAHNPCLSKLHIRLGTEPRVVGVSR